MDMRKIPGRIKQQFMQIVWFENSTTRTLGLLVRFHLSLYIILVGQTLQSGGGMTVHHVCHLY
jgi:hypothetical protein